MLSTKRKGVLPMDGAYMGSYDFPPYGKGRIGWYDNKKGWVEFSTHEERLRYILDRKFRVPSEWIDAICDRFPNKEWSMIEIEWIASEYRETSKELGALLEEIEGWE